jgi:hypothetical protein
LPFGGQKNNGTEVQGPYRAAAAKLRGGGHGSYVDDWVGWADTESQLYNDYTESQLYNDYTESQLYNDFADFLQVCDKHGITLETGKTKFDYPSAQFFGFRQSGHKRSRLATKHLDSLRKLCLCLVPPH